MLHICYNFNVSVAYTDDTQDNICIIYDQGGYREISSNNILNMVKRLPAINNFLTVIGLSNETSYIPDHIKDYVFRFSAITSNGNINVIGSNNELTYPITDNLNEVISELLLEENFKNLFVVDNYYFYSQDGNWDNIDNWYYKLIIIGGVVGTDSINANSLPGENDKVIVISNVTTSSFISTVRQIEVIADHEEIYFEIELNVKDYAVFIGNVKMAGTINGNATFKGNSTNFGIINGDATFLDYSTNYGIAGLNKDDVGLGNVDNTSDINKPISLAMQEALDNKANLDDVIPLVEGLIPLNILPSKVAISDVVKAGSGTQIKNLVLISQTDYDSLIIKDSETLYFIQ